MTFFSPTTRATLKTNLRNWLPSIGVFLFLGFITLLPEFAGIAHAATATTSAAPAAPATQATNAGNGFWGWALGGAFGGVAQLIFSLAGFLFGLVGMLFNWIVVLTVFQFGSYFGNSAGMLIAWGVLRDIGNIILLFGFIFMGILMILDLDHGGSKKAIPGLIIFAILLNFSLFASEAIVDVSNVLSSSIFNQAGQCTSVSGCGLTAAASGTAATTNTGISGVIMSTLGLGTLFNPSSANLQALAQNGTQGVLFLIGSAIFITIAMVVLLAGSIMLFIRAITLVFLLVVSPIGFAAMAIPPLSGVANRWWKLLISQAFFAPVFLLLILVSVKILSGIGTQTGTGGSMSFADAIANPSSSNVGIFLIFGLMIGFFIAALMVAKSLGAIGADFATNVATKTVRGTVSAPFRAGAFGAGIAYRSTVAPAADKGIRRYNTLVGNAIQKGGVGGAIARNLDYMAGGAITGSLSKAKNVSIGGVRNYDDEKKYRAGRTHDTEHASHLDHQSQDIKAGLAAGATSAQKDAMERSLQQMPIKDKIALMNTLNKSEREGAAKVMSFAVFKEIYNNHDLSSAAKADLMSGKYGDIITAAKNHDAAAPALKDNKLAARDIEFLTLNAPETVIDLVQTADPTTEKSVVKEAVIEKALEGDVLTTSQRTAFEGARMHEKLNTATAQLATPGISPEDRTAILGKIERIVANTDKIGRAKKEAIFTAADEVGLAKHHVASIVAENQLKGPDADILIGKVQRYHDTHKTQPGYDMAKFTRLQKYIQNNQAAKTFFNHPTLTA